MIKEVEIKANGGPEKILWKDCELETLKSGEVTIEHTFVGLNFIDTYHRSGLYPLTLPTKLGMEGAGVVVDKASDVNEYKVGDRVAYVMALGSYSTKRNIEANKLVKIPKSVTDQLSRIKCRLIRPTYFLILLCGTNDNGVIISDLSLCIVIGLFDMVRFTSSSNGNRSVSIELVWSPCSNLSNASID